MTFSSSCNFKIPHTEPMNSIKLPINSVKLYFS